MSAQTTLGKAYLMTKQYAKALELASSWKKNSPDDPVPNLLAGDVYTRQQKFLGTGIQLIVGRE